MSQTIYDQSDSAETAAQLLKVIDLDTLKKAAKAYIWGKEYRKHRQSEQTRLAKLAIAAGLDK